VASQQVSKSVSEIRIWKLPGLGMWGGAESWNGCGQRRGEVRAYIRG
jgi:hypothetical protein